MKDDSYTVPIEGIIYRSFVKHARLQQIVYETFSNSSIATACSLDIFVDMYSILKQIFSEHFRTIIDDYTAIVTCIINLCSHYRHFFRSLGVETKFYLICSLNIHETNSLFVSEYNAVFKEKSNIQMFRNLYNNNIELLELIVPYLPGIYFIKSDKNYETSVIMANLIEKLDPTLPKMILSRDLYPIQLCALYPYVSYLYPLKSRGEDNSLMVPISEKYDFREKFWWLVAHCRNYTTYNELLSVSPLNFSILSAMSKAPERNLSSVFKTPYCIRILNQIVGTEDIRVNPAQLYEKDDKISISTIESRYKVLDVPFMLNYYKQDPESSHIQLLDLRDDSAINHINAKFFSKNPIDLQRL